MKSNFLDFPCFDTSSPSILTLNGENQKKLLIIIADEEDKNTHNLDFLEKIIGAIKYDLNKDTIYSFANPQLKVTISELIEDKKIKNLIVFGVSPQQLGIYAEQRKYQPFTLQSVNYLFSDDLSALQTQKELKAALWDALKKIFIL